MNRGDKLALATAFTTLGGGLFFVPQFADGYRVSVFGHLPVALLVAGVALTLLSVGSAVWSLFHGRYRSAVYRLLPFVALYSLVLVLPLLLGYVVPLGDQASHVGYIRAILQTNSLPELPQQRYPFMHILGAVLSGSSGLAPATVAELLRVVLFWHVTALSALLGRQWTPGAIYGLVPATLVGALALSTSSFSLFTVFPLALYLLTRVRRTRDRRYLLVGIGVYAAIWPFHPMPAIILGVVSTAIVATMPVAGRLSSLFDTRSSRPQSQFVLVITLCGIVGYLWLVDSRFIVFLVAGLQGLLQTVVNTAGGGSGSGSYLSSGSIFAIFSAYGFGPLDVLSVIVRYYGPWVLLGGMAALSAFVGLASDGDRLPPVEFVVAVGLCGVWAVFEFVVGIIPAVNVTRLIRPVAILSPVLAGCLLVAIVSWGRRQSRPVQLSTVLILGLVLSSGAFLTTAGTHAGPWMLVENNYATESGVEGYEWHADHMNTELRTTDILKGSSTGRYFSYVDPIFMLETDHPSVAAMTVSQRYNTPLRFGYPDAALGDAGDRYHVQTIRDRRVKTGRYERRRFRPSDFERLNADPTANKVYANGDVEIYRVYDSTG
ncbi:hypothetical protein [Haloarcula montana]|uniref:hypothetical protein n=1 Tax=Haloarcula montana TaxID=3111776 RepID=UPI002D79A721|nr:hypothetical protein [Haloarcula sp. GH36]